MVFLLVLMAMFLISYTILRRWFSVRLQIEQRVWEIRKDHRILGNGNEALDDEPKWKQTKIPRWNLAKGIIQELDQVGIHLSRQEWTIIGVVAFLLMMLVYIAKHSILGPVVVLLFMFILYKLMINVHKKKRAKKFEEGLGDMLTSATGALKAGYSLFQALDTVAKETKGQVGEEFTKILKEISLGVAVEDALIHAQERVPSNDFELIINAILIQRQVGGNLSEVLDIVAETIRERLRMRGEVRALTAQGRMSMWIFVLMAPIIALIMFFFNPTYLSYLWTTKVGWVLLMIAFVGQLIGVFLIRRIVHFEV